MLSHVDIAVAPPAASRTNRRSEADPLKDATTSTAAFALALERLDCYARMDGLPVLIEGETGTGKSLFARALHARSPRRDRPYHQVNLAALDDALANSDLFGHVSGAFTGAARSRTGLLASADRGTLFLDEIGQTSPTIQRKLLHVIEHGQFYPVGGERPVVVDTRLVAAMNALARDLVREGRFLLDLLQRLQPLRIWIPPLRERRMDILPLATSLLERDALRFLGRAAPRLEPALCRRLERVRWPGNIRQLEGILRRLLAHASEAAVLTLALFERVTDAEELEGDIAPLAVPARPSVEDAVEATTARTREAAAAMLGVSRSTVQRRLRAAKQGAPQD
jgi:transcriptional regulator with PAS, ATPase and Fis domain